ncbi:MAG: GxxExxY protein [Verrucomicrobiae bacterium]|nr:GxxExxY protein [Verrucomicrobiae bacterium]
MEKDKLVKEIIYKEECYAIIGACFTVYNEKGRGFLEGVYQECLEIEFNYLKISAISKPQLTLTYRDQILQQTYTPDFVCFGKIILELKTAAKIIDEHRGQVLNYLNATGFQLGLLVNFGHYPKLEYERIVNSKQTKDEPIFL